MRNAVNAQVLANIARMRGDRRRHVRVLLLKVGVDMLGLVGSDVSHIYRIIGAPSIEVAREAKDILIENGWSESATPEQLSQASFSLSPPCDDCGPRKPELARHSERSAEAQDGDPATRETVPTHDPANGSAVITVYAPNLIALAILQEVHERQRDRLSSASNKTQVYLREARSGGMYGNGGTDDE